MRRQKRENDLFKTIDVNINAVTGYTTTKLASLVCIRIPSVLHFRCTFGKRVSRSDRLGGSRVGRSERIRRRDFRLRGRSASSRRARWRTKWVGGNSQLGRRKIERAVKIGGQRDIAVDRVSAFPTNWVQEEDQEQFNHNHSQNEYLRGDSGGESGANSTSSSSWSCE